MSLCEPQLTFQLYMYQKMAFHFLTLGFIPPYLVQSSSAQSMAIQRLDVSAALWPQQALVWLPSLAAQLGPVASASSPAPPLFWVR